MPAVYFFREETDTHLFSRNGAATHGKSKNWSFPSLAVLYLPPKLLLTAKDWFHEVSQVSERISQLT